MPNLWDRPPREDMGDAHPSLTYHAIGSALTHWEVLESFLAELFDALVSGAKASHSNRAGFAAYSAVDGSSSRSSMLLAAIRRALNHEEHLELRKDTEAFVKRVKEFSARRNEVAHGMVLNLGDFGHYLAPNNIRPSRWTPEGTAKYQYTSSQINGFAKLFHQLRLECEEITERIANRVNC